MVTGFTFKKAATNIWKILIRILLKRKEKSRLKRNELLNSHFRRARRYCEILAEMLEITVRNFILRI